MCRVSFFYLLFTFNHRVSFSAKTGRAIWRVQVPLNNDDHFSRYWSSYLYSILNSGIGHWLLNNDRHKKLSPNSIAISAIPTGEHYILRIVSINWFRKRNMFETLHQIVSNSRSASQHWRIQFYCETFSCFQSCRSEIHSWDATDRTFLVTINVWADHLCLTGIGWIMRQRNKQLTPNPPNLTIVCSCGLRTATRIFSEQNTLWNHPLLSTLFRYIFTSIKCVIYYLKFKLLGFTYEKKYYSTKYVF